MLRREFVSSAVGATILASIPTKSKSGDDPCAYHANELLREMEKRHGGKWVVSVDHDHLTIFGRKIR